MKLSSAAMALGAVSVASGHTVWMCTNIISDETQLVVYAATYHTNEKAGGIIIAGPGNNSATAQYGYCTDPYESYADAIGGCGAEPNCGTRFDFGGTDPMTYAQVRAEAPSRNCGAIGDAESFYPIASPSLTWNKVTIPISSCGDGFVYSFTSTSDTAIEAPFRNVWATVECVDGTGFNCGDGVVDDGEECEDGNSQDCDACTNSCVLTPNLNICGDCFVDTDEECDDGNRNDSDGCSANCTLEFCGDGIVTPLFFEECDDGNNITGDGCNDCTLEECQTNWDCFNCIGCDDQQCQCSTPTDENNSAEIGKYEKNEKRCLCHDDKDTASNNNGHDNGQKTRTHGGNLRKVSSNEGY